MFDDDLRQILRQVDKVAMPVAAARDAYLEFRRGNTRFMRLGEVYSNLRTLETARFEYVEAKAPTFGKKPNREVLMIVRAAVENAKVLLDIAEDEIAHLRSKQNA